MIVRSNRSIKLIACVTPTIHRTVNIIENASPSSVVFKNGKSMSPILMPNATATNAAITCPINFVIGFIVLISSTIHTIDITKIPKNIP